MNEITALPKAIKARSLHLQAQADALQAFGLIVRSALEQLRDNAELLVQAYDEEYIHQLRVAARRLRSALALFGVAEPALRRPPFLPALRRLARTLGESRDRDVLCAETLPRLLDEDDGLHAHFAVGRQQARVAAVSAIEAAAFATLLADIESWLDGLGRDARAPLHKAIGKLAPRLLERRLHRLRKRGRHLAQLPDAERHAARIAAKELRYAAEFLGSLYPAERVKPFIHALAALQDTLGRLNDLVTLERLCADLTDAHAAAHLLAAGRADACAAHAELDQVWQCFRHTPAFWHQD
ncbi:CHAD domain-containing protein [Plasticicumulans acidivorans]|uniref:CHAD domain-containing protein n=1 Tax=Plasticicumulans acidivorans TaxID=886464 RepID=A0A317MRE3_9GAMM|nr:CHAD domain-containing protein [Plasticicumulans acidivorans]PWV59276.1 CHAD domain-containing protein [Plasticicumulans acidivorans]